MKIFGIQIGKSKSAKTVVNVDRSQPRSSRIKEKIIVRQQIRQQEDVGNYRRATRQAESVILPNRTPLTRIYNDVVIDAHLTSLMQAIIDKCLASDYWLHDSDGKIDDEETAKLRAPWFRQMLEGALESISWGHSLVELNGPIIDDRFASAKVINRLNVVPELHSVKAEKDISSSLIPYNTPLYRNWLVEFGSNEKDFGLLFKATPWVLWKRNVSIAWSEYAEIFGMPFRVGKTDIGDPEKRFNMDDMLAKMGGAGHATLDESDTIEFVANNNEDAHDVFKEFIEVANKELSKLFLGQTMTTEDGSSRSQSEVHERTQRDRITSIKIWLEFQVNNKVIPILERQGMIKPGLVWRLDNSESLDLKSMGELIDKLLDNYNIPTDYINNTFGIPVEEKPDLPDSRNENTSIMNKVFNMYKNAKTHS